MSGRFEPYQDENSLLGQAQRPRENLQPLSGFGAGKRALSGTRQALGNITNNGSVQVAKQAISREVLVGNDKHGRQGKHESVETRQERVVSTSGRTDEEACVDELMRGGMERPAGSTWDVQVAGREMELMDKGSVDAAGHLAAAQARVVGLCRSLQDVGEAHRREAIDAVFREDSGQWGLGRVDVGIPASPEKALSVLNDIHGEDVFP